VHVSLSCMAAGLFCRFIGLRRVYVGLFYVNGDLSDVFVGLFYVLVSFMCM